VEVIKVMLCLMEVMGSVLFLIVFVKITNLLSNQVKWFKTES